MTMSTVLAPEITTPAPGDPEPARSGRATVIRTLRLAGVIVAGCWLVALLAAAVLAPWLPLQSPSEPDYMAIATGPSGHHLLGTDTIGRDILSRVVFGARVSLLVSVLAVVVGVVVGGLGGLLAGFYSGSRLDRLLLVATDSVMAFPGLVFLLAVVAVIGPGRTAIVVGLTVLSLPAMFRLVRANTLLFSRREFVTAATLYGAPARRVMMREIVPNVSLPTLAYAFILVGTFIVMEGSLSFLGLGIAPPTPSWGSMIAGGRAVLLETPHISLIPAAVMFMTVLSINIVGEYGRGRFDVKASQL